MQETKNVMNMARHFNNHREKPHANHKTHLHAMKAYNSGPVYSLTKEIFTEVFICSKVINAFKR